MRILFAGTPDIAVPSLRLLAQYHTIVGVLTSPDAPTGRGRQETPPAVKVAAQELGLPIFQPAKLDADARAAIAGLEPDLLVCLAYGMIFGPKFLALFPQGGINLHPSLLPRWRGPSPLTAAILAGDRQSGISIQRLALEMDAGDLLCQESLDLNGSETTASLSDWAAQRGAQLLLETVNKIEGGSVQATPQASVGISFCHLINKADGLIDWSLPAIEIDRRVRAYNPWPRAFTTWEAQTLYILESQPQSDPDSGQAAGNVLRVDKSRGILVQTGQGLLALRRLQLQAKKGMDFQSFLNGARGFIGGALGA